MNYTEFRASRGGTFTRNLIGESFLQAQRLALSCFWRRARIRTASGQHATVLMRDGTTLTGTVTATSPAEITLTGDDSVTHTVPMTQVKSIEYDDATAAQSPATPSSDTQSSAATAGRQPRPRGARQHPKRSRRCARTSLSSDAGRDSNQDLRAAGEHQSSRANGRDDRFRHSGRRPDLCG